LSQPGGLSEEHYKLLVDAVVDYALYTIGLDGTVRTWNAGAERIKGYTEAEILGAPYACFYTEEDRAAGIPERNLARARAEGRAETEGWRIRKDGSRFWAHAVIDAMRDERGALIGFAKITRDVTERREAQRALTEASERLAQAQRLEAVGRLTGGVAHDFNNLLQVVTAATRLMSETMPPGDEEAAQLLKAIRDAAERGARLTRQLLAFSRRLPLSPEVIHSSGRIAEAIAFAEHSLRGAEIAIESDIPADLWPVEVDASQLGLAILNIALNARDAMPQGGRLRFTARNERLSDPVAGLEGEYLVLRIRDTGSGIPKEYLGRVLEPFFTTKPVGKGTGLGLSQAYGFARQSGGNLSIESEEGRGTTVTICIPGRRNAVAAAMPAPAKAPRPMLRPASILVVDDDAEVGGFTRRLLLGMGHRATVVNNGGSALELLDQPGQGYDLVLTDIVMPGMSGIELAHSIRARWPQLPVLLATGYAESAAGGAGREFPILGKPFDADTLAGVLARLSSAAAV